MSFEEICRKLSKCQTEPDLITIPDIFDFKEPDITKWLAYLLDPEKNGFGNAPLNALLKLAKADDIPEYQEIQITREYHFSETGIIDLLIETPDRIIGIEHKLWSGETWTNGKPQTEVYYRNLKKKAKKKNLVCIFLKPQANTTPPACSEFQPVTYTDLIQEWKQIPYDTRRESRKNFLFYEFVLYAEEKLMSANQNSFPVGSGDAEVYQQYLTEIKKAEKDYKDYADSFDDWFRNAFSDAEKLLELREKRNGGYWVIVRAPEWRNLDFHFELLWDSERLCSAKCIWVEVHLEGWQSKSLRPEFEKAGFSSKGRTLCSETVQADFSDEEKALQTVKEIIKILNSESFQKCAEIADGFCK